VLAKAGSTVMRRVAAGGTDRGIQKEFPEMIPRGERRTVFRRGASDLTINVMGGGPRKGAEEGTVLEGAMGEKSRGCT